MNMDKRFAENPENELWRELLQFSYRANIERYFEEHSFEKDTEVMDCISGSFLQAYEYYKSSNEVNLQISPLLLYYGTTNLLNGMICLLQGKICEIHNHGMKTEVEKQGYIADTKIFFENNQTGGVHVFARELGYNEDLTRYGIWELKELFASVAEICEDYKKCYSEKCGNALMLNVVKTHDGRIEKLYYSQSILDEILKKLDNVENFYNEYLVPQKGKERDGNEYLILRHKMAGKDITQISFSGQPYLLAGHKKNGKLLTLPVILNMYVALFTMGSLCRYHPEIWSPFVLNDKTGEKLLVERFLYYARRIIPNIVLDTIYGKRITYVTEKYFAEDKIEHVSEYEVLELIQKEVYRQVNKNDMRR